MNDDFIEALLLWSENGASDSVNQWLSDRSLNTIPMKAGLLITGSKRQIELAFAIDLTQAEPPIALPVPTEIKAYVASIEIPKPRQIY